MKTLLGWIPLLAFFVIYQWHGLLPATAVLVALTLLQTGVIYLKEKKIATIPLASAMLVAVFGLLTIVSENPLFIKMKPTVLYALFGIMLIVGVYVFRRGWIGLVLGKALSLPEEAWQTLSLRWAVFFLLMAALNEYVWRNFSTDSWVTFKVFGALPLIFAFTLMQIPFIMRHSEEEAKQES